MTNSFFIDNLDLILSTIKKNISHAPSISFIAIQSKDPFKILISTILSTRTKDETTINATNNLFSVIKTPYDLVKLNLKKIENLIYPVGFYKTKARNLHEVSKTLINNHKGKVPNSFEDLMKLKGVGRKVANLVLIEAFYVPRICVDTHVHRLSNRFGIINTNNSNESEFDLMKIIPKKYWIKYNFLLVAYGQTICRPISPFCSSCKIAKFCQKKDVLIFR